MKNTRLLAREAGIDAARERAAIRARKQVALRKGLRVQVVCHGGPWHGHKLAVPRDDGYGRPTPVSTYSTAVFTASGQRGRYSLVDGREDRLGWFLNWIEEK